MPILASEPLWRAPTRKVAFGNIALGNIPLFVLGLTAAIAGILGAIDTSGTDWDKTLLNVGLMSSTGVLRVLITEEGFFAAGFGPALKRAGESDTEALLWTIVAFVAWHLSVISLDTGFELPAREIPIYLINGAILGII